MFIFACCLCVNSNVYAQNLNNVENTSNEATPEMLPGKYFNFIPERLLTRSDQTLSVEFLFDLGDLKVSQFKVRPKSDNQIIKIINDAVEIDSNSFWTKMPYLDVAKKIKVFGSFDSFVLWFEILDENTGKVYTTSRYTIWNGGLLDQYLAKFNANLLSEPTK